MTTSTTPVHIDDELAELIGSAYDNKRPIVVAYADDEGQPHLSFRGSTQGYSDTQLAMWIRERGGGIVRAMAHNPRITLMYRDSSTRTTYLFYGRGHLEHDEVIGRQIWERSPEGERNRDPEMQGVAIVVDIDAIQGGPPDRKVNMHA